MAKRSKRKKAAPPVPIEPVRLQPEPPVRFGTKTLLQSAILIVATLWIYWPALQGDLIWDDIALVSTNSNLRSLHGLWNLWFATPASDYWPLTWTFLWIEWHLWGNQPLGYHLCSLALHIASAFLLWRLLCRLGLRGGWIGALLFVIHPLAVESVAWISEIKNTLSLPFFLLACDAWLDAEEQKNSGYLRSIFYYLAAMLAKTSTVMLPAILLLYCWWKRGRVTRQEIGRMTPYAAIALVMGAVTIYFQTHGYDDHPIETGDFSARLMGAIFGIFFYLQKFALPLDLITIYPRWNFDSFSLLQLLVVLGLFGTAFALWHQRKGWGRHAIFGLGFFALNLLPVLGLLKMRYMGITSVADHFVYLPMLGLIALVVGSVDQAAALLPPTARPIGIGAIAMALLLLFSMSRDYAGHYLNQETFWSYTAERNPDAWLAHVNLGNAYYREGRLPEALEEFQTTVRLYPNSPEAYNDLAGTLVDMGRTADAIAPYQQALVVNPTYAEAHLNFALALFKLSRNREGLDHLQQALKLRPESASIHYSAGVDLAQIGRIQDAISQYEQAVSIDPLYADALDNLGLLLLQAGGTQDAMNRFEQVLQVDPGNAAAHNNLGIVLMQTGHYPEALDQYRQALALRPDYAEVLSNTGNVYFQMGQYPEAIAQYQDALRLNPNYPSAHNNLGTALQRTGQLSEALAQYEEAVRLDPSSADCRKNLSDLQARLKASPAKK